MPEAMAYFSVIQVIACFFDFCDSAIVMAITHNRIPGQLLGSTEVNVAFASE